METTVAKEREVRDREAGEYDAHRGQDRWLVEVEDACVLDALDLGAGQIVVDVGSGTGRLLPTLLERAGRVIAVDHSERSLDIARRRVPEGALDRLELVAADVRALPLEDASCDRVLCVGVLQHVPSHAARLQAARELLRVLRPGGVLAASAYHWRGHIKRRKESAWATGIYYFAFTTGEFRMLFREAAFRDVEVGGAGVLPPLSRRLGLGVGVQRRLAFTPVGRLLADYVVARAVRPA